MRALGFFGLLSLVVFLGGCSNDEIITPQEQLERDIAAIDAYLASEGIDAIEDPSGLRYVVNVAGTGTTPSIASQVTTNYEGRFFDGGVFDSGNGVSFPVNGVIVGWQIMLTKMNQGDEVTVYIPSGLAYGTRGQGSIPPNTNLIFDITLIDVF